MRRVPLRRLRLAFAAIVAAAAPSHADLPLAEPRCHRLSRVGGFIGSEESLNQAIHGLVPVTVRARFACQGDGPQTIEAVFFASEAPSALLRAGDREVLVLQKPAASGARYEGDGVMFWNQGDAAQVSWEEIELRCRVAK